MHFLRCRSSSSPLHWRLCICFPFEYLIGEGQICCICYATIGRKEQRDVLIGFDGRALPMLPSRHSHLSSVRGEYQRCARRNVPFSLRQSSLQAVQYDQETASSESQSKDARRGRYRRKSADDRRLVNGRQRQGFDEKIAQCLGPRSGYGRRRSAATERTCHSSLDDHHAYHCSVHLGWCDDLQCVRTVDTDASRVLLLHHAG